MTMRARLAPCLGLLAGLMCAWAAFAQTYPSKPVRLIVAWPAGGTVDSLSRVVAPKLAEGLGQPVVVENKPGAGGSVAAAEVAKTRPDGHTLLSVFDTQAINHLLYSNLGYDTFRSFEYISQLVSSPQMLVAANNFPPSTVSELIAYAKANPGRVTYASVGAGSSNQLNVVLLAARAGLEMTHVPYKGGSPAMQDLMAGQVNVMIVSVPNAMAYANAGRIKAIAVGSARRLAQFPQVPAIAETLPGYEAVSWAGLVGPAGIPKDIVARLSTEVRRTLAAGEARDKLTALGFEIVASTPEQFLAMVRAESDKWGKIIRSHQIKVD